MLSGRGRGVKVKKLERPRPLRSCSITSESKLTKEASLLNRLDIVIRDIDEGGFPLSDLRHIAEELIESGSFLEDSAKDQLDSNFVSLRNTAKRCTTHPLLVLYILQLIELRARRWKFDENTFKYYEKKIRELSVHSEEKTITPVKDRTENIRKESFLTPIYKDPSPCKIGKSARKFQHSLRKSHSYEEKVFSVTSDQNVKLSSNCESEVDPCSFQSTVVPDEIKFEDLKDIVVSVSTDGCREENGGSVEFCGISGDIRSYKKDSKSYDDLRVTVKNDKIENMQITICNDVTDEKEQYESNKLHGIIEGISPLEKQKECNINISDQNNVKKACDELGQLQVIVLPSDDMGKKEHMTEVDSVIPDQKAYGKFCHCQASIPLDEHWQCDEDSDGSSTPSESDSDNSSVTSLKSCAEFMDGVWKSKLRMDSKKEKENKTCKQRMSTLFSISIKEATVLLLPKVYGFIAAATGTEIQRLEVRTDESIVIFEIRGNTKARNKAIKLISERCSESLIKNPILKIPLKRDFQVVQRKDTREFVNVCNEFEKNKEDIRHLSQDTEQVPGTLKYQFKLTVSASKIGRVFGVKGGRLKIVEQLTNCRLAVLGKKGDPKQQVIISGNSNSSVKKAVGLIDDIITKNIDPEKYIDLPKTVGIGRNDSDIEESQQDELPETGDKRIVVLNVEHGNNMESVEEVSDDNDYIDLPKTFGHNDIGESQLNGLSETGDKRIVVLNMEQHGNNNNVQSVKDMSDDNDTTFVDDYDPTSCVGAAEQNNTGPEYLKNIPSIRRTILNENAITRPQDVSDLRYGTEDGASGDSGAGSSQLKKEYLEVKSWDRSVTPEVNAVSAVSIVDEECTVFHYRIKVGSDTIGISGTDKDLVKESRDVLLHHFMPKTMQTPDVDIKSSTPHERHNQTKCRKESTDLPSLHEDSLVSFNSSLDATSSPKRTWKIDTEAFRRVAESCGIIPRPRMKSQENYDIGTGDDESWLLQENNIELCELNESMKHLSLDSGNDGKQSLHRSKLSSDPFEMNTPMLNSGLPKLSNQHLNVPAKESEKLIQENAEMEKEEVQRPACYAKRKYVNGGSQSVILLREPIQPHFTKEKCAAIKTGKPDVFGSVVYRRCMFANAKQNNSETFIKTAFETQSESSSIASDKPIAYYPRESILELAKSPYAKDRPQEWGFLTKVLPEVCLREVNEYFDPDNYKERCIPASVFSGKPYPVKSCYIPRRENIVRQSNASNYMETESNIATVGSCSELDLGEIENSVLTSVNTVDNSNGDIVLQANRNDGKSAPVLPPARPSSVPLEIMKQNMKPL